MLSSTHFNEVLIHFHIIRLPRAQGTVVAGLLCREQSKPNIFVTPIVRLRYYFMGMAATFEEGIAVFVALMRD